MKDRRGQRDTDADLGRTLRGMLAGEAPASAPPDLRSNILRRTAQMPQRSRWLDLPAFRPAARTLATSMAGAALLVAVVLIASFGLYTVGGRFVPGGASSTSPDPTSSGTPGTSPSPRGLVFTSERHGYSLLLPDESWQVASIPGTWDPGTRLFWAGNGVDRLLRTVAGADGQSPSVSAPVMYLSSQRLPAGLTFDDWARDYETLFESAESSCAPAVDEVGDALVAAKLGTLAGAETARVVSRRCQDPAPGLPGGDWRRVEVNVLHAGHIYVFRVEECPPAVTYFGSACERVEPSPAAELAAWLDRFEFTR